MIIREGNNDAATSFFEPDAWRYLGEAFLARAFWERQ
jgi:hypothetical protein